MTSSQEQECWEKNDQELKRLSLAIDAINQKTDEKFAALMEGQTKLLSLLGSKFEEIPRRQLVIHTLDQEETNLEWICQKERNRIEDDLDEFLEGFGHEISPLYMLQKAVQNGFIQSFKPTSTHEIYEKIGKGICDICDEYADSEHSHKGYSLLILHPNRKDELMAFVFHKERKEDVHEESVKVENMGQKVREPNICEDQLIDQKLKNQEDIAGKTDLKFKEEIKDICEEQIRVLEENLKGKEEYPNMEEEKKIMCKLNEKLLQQNKEKCYKKNGMALGKRIIKKKPGMGKGKVKIKKKSRMYLRKRRIKKNKETMEKNNNVIKKIRRKTQERRNKKTRRIIDVQVCSGSGGGPGRRRRNNGKTGAGKTAAATTSNLAVSVEKRCEKQWREEKEVAGSAGNTCSVKKLAGKNGGAGEGNMTVIFLKDTLTYLFGFISAPTVDGSRVEATIGFRVTFYPP